MSWSYPPALPTRNPRRTWFPTPPMPSAEVARPTWFPYITADAAAGLAGRLQALEAQLQGTHGQASTLAATLHPLTAHLQGEHATAGQLAAAMRALRFAGTNIITGDLAAALRPLRAAMVGGHGVEGELRAALRPLVAAMSGQQINYGQLTGALPALRASLAGSTRIDSQLAAALARLQASMSGQQSQTGTLAAALRALQFSGLGVHSQSGQLAGGLRPITSGMVGSVTNAVVFDNSSDGGNGGTATRSWIHDNIAGNSIGVMFSTATGAAPNCTYGGVSIPRVYGPVVSGSVFPTTAYISVFALVSNSLPTGPNTVSCANGSAASAAGAVTFANAGSLGTILSTAAAGNLNETINPGDGAAAFCGFGAGSSNFGAVAPNEIVRKSFMAFNTWACMMGYGLDTGAGINFVSSHSGSKAGAIVPILPP